MRAQYHLEDPKAIVHTHTPARKTLAEGHTVKKMTKELIHCAVVAPRDRSRKKRSISGRWTVALAIKAVFHETDTDFDLNELTLHLKYFSPSVERATIVTADEAYSVRTVVFEFREKQQDKVSRDPVKRRSRTVYKAKLPSESL